MISVTFIYMSRKCYLNFWFIAFVGDKKSLSAFHAYSRMFFYYIEITFSYRPLIPQCFISFFITYFYVLHDMLYIHTTIYIFFVLYNSFSSCLQCANAQIIKHDYAVRKILKHTTWLYNINSIVVWNKVNVILSAYKFYSDIGICYFFCKSV